MVSLLEKLERRRQREVSHQETQTDEGMWLQLPTKDQRNKPNLFEGKTVMLNMRSSGLHIKLK